MSNDLSGSTVAWRGRLGGWQARERAHTRVRVSETMAACALRPHVCKLRSGGARVLGPERVEMRIALATCDDAGDSFEKREAIDSQRLDTEAKTSNH